MTEIEKECRLCGIIKPISSYRLRGDSGKYRNECKDCCNRRSREWRRDHKEQVAAHNKKYRAEHLEELKAYSKHYQEMHLEKFREYNKISRERRTEEQKARANERDRRYRERQKNNPDYIAKRREWDRQSTKRRRKQITAYEEMRKKNDPVFKLKKQTRNEIRASFNRRGLKKSAHTDEIIGCSQAFLCKHLLDTYEQRYGTEYDGRTSVHIDHIKPLSNAHSAEEVISLCKWNNLQLLKAEDNLLKSNKKSF